MRVGEDTDEDGWWPRPARFSRKPPNEPLSQAQPAGDGSQPSDAVCARDLGFSPLDYSGGGASLARAD